MKSETKAKTFCLTCQGVSGGGARGWSVVGGAAGPGGRERAGARGAGGGPVSPPAPGGIFHVESTVEVAGLPGAGRAVANSIKEANHVSQSARVGRGAVPGRGSGLLDGGDRPGGRPCRRRPRRGLPRRAPRLPPGPPPPRPP